MKQTSLRFETFILIVISFYFQIDAKNLVCYYDVSAYLDGEAVKPSQINASLCTHYVYSYATTNSTTFEITSSDPTNDIANKGYKNFTGLKQLNRDAKFLLGYSSSIDDYENVISQVTRNDTLIKTLVDSTLLFLKQYDFDGLSVDWIFPTSSLKLVGYHKLLIAFKEAFQSTPYILSSTVPAIPTDITGYNETVLNNCLDLVFVYTIIYHECLNEASKVRHHMPLYRTPGDSVSDTMNANYSINAWLTKGLNPRLIHLVISLYSMNWKLSSAAVEPYQPPVAGSGCAYSYIASFNEDGTIFRDICSLTSTWKVYRDPNNSTGPWAVGIAPFKSYKTWMGYDDPQMVAVKSNYILNSNLGGVMLWDLSQDDSKGICGLGLYPITSAASAILIDSYYTTTTGKTTPTTTPTTTMKGFTGIQPNPIQTTAKNQVKCSSSNEILPDPTSCHKFNICLNGTAYVSECPLGRYFNPNTLNCEDDPDNIKCPIAKQSKQSEALSYNAVKYDWKVNY